MTPSTRDIPEQYVDRVVEPKPFLSEAETASLVTLFAPSKQPTAAAPSHSVPPDMRYIKALMPSHSVMVGEVLRSGIFALSARTAANRRPVCKFNDVTDFSKGSTVEYKGERLVQADLTVLLALIHAGAATPADAAIMEVDAGDFLRSINRSDCSRGVKALRDSLASLRSATLVVKRFAGERGAAFGFIDFVEWDKRRIRVQLSEKLRKAIYTLQRSYVNLGLRNQLADGVQTALHDLIRSTNAESFDLSALAVQWGREQRELGRDVRTALERLVEVGVIDGWSKTRGRVHVRRAEDYSRK